MQARVLDQISARVYMWEGKEGKAQNDRDERANQHKKRTSQSKDKCNELQFGNESVYFSV